MKKGLIVSLRLCFLPYIVWFLFTLSPALVFADESRQGRYYFGADLGVAQMDLKRGDNNESDIWLYGALRVEYALLHQLLVGAEGAGWTDQSNVNSPISEDVLTFMMTARIYPWQESGAYAKAGWGYANHRYWESDTSSDASGTVFLIGLGYDINIETLSVSYSSNDLDQETYKALTFSLGFTF